MVKDEEKTTGAEPWHSRGSNIIFPRVCLSDPNSFSLSRFSQQTQNHLYISNGLFNHSGLIMHYF